MNGIPKMADLRAMAETLNIAEPGSTLSKAVESASRAQSCVADISLAITSLEAFTQLRSSRKLPKMHQAAAENALVSNAVFLYSRAAGTGARTGERGHIAIRNRLPSKLQIDHDAIIEIRHDVQTHIKSNREVQGKIWHRDIVFAAEQSPGEWLPAAMTRRVQISETLLKSLRRLLPEALVLMRETFWKRLHYLTDQLNARPDGEYLLESHLLDPVEIFGSESEARKALRRKPGQRTTGLVDH